LKNGGTIRVVPFLGISEALWSQTTLAWCCRRDRIDLFWGATQSVPLFANHKSVITIHDFAYRLYPKTVPFVRGAYLKLFGKWLYKKANSITTNSKGSAERLQQLYGLQAHKVILPPFKNIVVPSQEKVHEILKEYSLTYKGYFLMVGTYEPRKNIVSTLRAHNSRHPLVLVGGEGWRDALISQELERKPKNIMALGYLPDLTLNALVKGAKAFVMPSLYEGYGQPIAEARVLGTPVVCCDVPEMIEAAEGDALIIPHDQLERAFTTPLTPPKKPTYPSNEELATILSKEFSRLYQQIEGCD